MADNFEKQRELFLAKRIGIIRDEAAPERAIIFSPAKSTTAELINKLLSITGGITFVALTPTRYEAFRLAPMEGARGTNLQSQTSTWAVSVEAREGVTTGISACDRAKTIAILGDDIPNPKQLVSPGHIFPVLTREGGVLVKNALPEAAVDMVSIAGSSPVAVYLDLLDADGNLMNQAAQELLAKREDLPIFELSEIVRYRLQHEKLISKVAEAMLPTKLGGEMRSLVYRSALHGGEHFALVCGDISGDAPVLTRVQPEFTFADVFGGNNPPTKNQLDESIREIGKQGRGVLVYLRRTNPGSLEKQVRSWSSEFFDNKAASMKEYGVGAQILRDLGVKKIELLTNSKRQFVGLSTFGIEIVGQRAFGQTGES